MIKTKRKIAQAIQPKALTFRQMINEIISELDTEINKKEVKLYKKPWYWF